MPQPEISEPDVPEREVITISSSDVSTDSADNTDNAGNAGNAHPFKDGTSAWKEARAKHKRDRMELGPPINALVASSFGPGKAMSASDLIGQYACAFEISQDPHFLNEKKKEMAMVDEKNTYITDDLTALYKFAYGTDINNELAREVLNIGGMCCIQCLCTSSDLA